MFIVIAYLTGMRPGEVLGLRHGCCPDPEPDACGRTSRHLIYGHEYKNAADEYGNHHSAGRERDVPWVAESADYLGFLCPAGFRGAAHAAQGVLRPHRLRAVSMPCGL
ncbi:hypothetical protein [Streptomyces cyanogenus]|uniref:hypothetical protein n=1 Tax=Streptomyces cyanogenus TaxID=80860 RepID=UPI001AA15E73